MGSIHALYFSVSNLALIFTPFLAGILIQSNADYWKIFALAALVLIPLAIFVRIEFRTFKDLDYRKSHLLSTIKDVWKRKDIRNITISSFFLQLFYSWMVVYTPLYLHNHIGMSWEAIGIVFSVMLLPFLIFEIPLGWLADNKIGEKEILITGFTITAFATMAVAFPSSRSIPIWATVLFLTRVGASFIEMASESYFFKKIKPEESNVISLFRMMRPASYVITPTIVGITISLTTFPHSFLILGALMVGGLYFALHIHDTL
jgi:MFS family permease